MADGCLVGPLRSTVRDGGEEWRNVKKRLLAGALPPDLYASFSPVVAV